MAKFFLVLLFIALAAALPNIPENGEDVTNTDQWVENPPAKAAPAQAASAARDWVQYPADASAAVLIQAEDFHVHDPHWSVDNHEKAFQFWMRDFGAQGLSEVEMKTTMHHHKDCCARAKVNLIQAMAANSTAKHTCHNSECGKSQRQWMRERNGMKKGAGAEDRCGHKVTHRLHKCGGPHKNEDNSKGCVPISQDEAHASMLQFEEKKDELIMMNAKQATNVGAPPCSESHHNVGEVRNQGSCGQCWTFSVVERLRHAMIEQHGQDPGKLSTQFLTNCMRKTRCTGGVDGCCGGDPASAVRWIREQGGIPSQEDYGHICNDAACTNAPSSLVDAGTPSWAQRSLLQVSHSGQGVTWAGQHPTTSFTCATVAKTLSVDADATRITTESAMANHLCGSSGTPGGTLMVAVDASQWQTYNGGVLAGSQCGTNLDHAVLLVGVSTSHNAWLIRNSWGEGWGASPTDPNAATSRDQYSNCPDLVSSYGCSQALSGGVTTGAVCQVSCPPASGVVTGGYIWLEYGQNTCGVVGSAYDTPTVSLVAGASSTSSSEDGTDSGSSNSEGYTSDGYSSDQTGPAPTPAPTPPAPTPPAPTPPPASSCTDTLPGTTPCSAYQSYCHYTHENYVITIPGTGTLNDLCKATCELC